MDIARYIADVDAQQKRLDALYHKAAVRFGLSDSAMWVLYELTRREEVCTQGELCRQCYFAKQTIHSTVSGFVRDGIVTLEAEDGRRGKKIVLTKKGRELAQKTTQAIFSAEKRAYGAVDEAALQTYLQIGEEILARLAAEMNALCGEENE